jgi:hypothetical protein
MSNIPGAQAQANKHAGRNRPSDIDELRDNIADIAGSVGDMASRQYEQAYDVATDTVERYHAMSLGYQVEHPASIEILGRDYVAVEQNDRGAFTPLDVM